MRQVRGRAPGPGLAPKGRRRDLDASAGHCDRPSHLCRLSQSGGIFRLARRAVAGLRVIPLRYGHRSRRSDGPAPNAPVPVLTGPRTLTFVSGESLLPVAVGAGDDRRSLLRDRRRGGRGGRSRLHDRASMPPAFSSVGPSPARTDSASGRESAPHRPRRGVDGPSRLQLRELPLARRRRAPRTRHPGDGRPRASRELAADRAALAAIDEAAHLWTAATRGEVVFALGAASATGTIVDIDVDPNDSAILSRGAAGVTRRHYSVGRRHRARADHPPQRRAGPEGPAEHPRARPRFRPRPLAPPRRRDVERARALRRQGTSPAREKLAVP